MANLVRSQTRLLGQPESNIAGTWRITRQVISQEQSARQTFAQREPGNWLTGLAGLTGF